MIPIAARMETEVPMMTFMVLLGGLWGARGPWGPKATKYAVEVSKGSHARDPSR
jgi:hypothetical protein